MLLVGNGQGFKESRGRNLPVEDEAETEDVQCGGGWGEGGRCLGSMLHC